MCWVLFVVCCGLLCVVVGCWFMRGVLFCAVCVVVRC